MDKIRLGNDIEMRWSIFTRDGDKKVPYNLEGRALTLSVVNRTGESEIEFFAEGNIVTGVFRGRDQRILGKHGVILRENNGENGMRTIDACDAFELVACSCEEAIGSPGTIQLFHLTFDSTIGAITGTIDPILNYEAEQAEAERKANEIIRKANEQQRIDNEKQRNVNEILRNIAEEERENAEKERIVNEDLRKADEAERKTNEESRVKSESERVSSEEERLYGESIRVTNENARIASEAKRAEAETARIEAEDKRIVSEKARLSAESSRIANEDSRRANEDSRLSAEAKRVSAEEERQIAEEERQAEFASMVVQTTGEATDKVMSQKSVTEALKGKQNKLTAGKGIFIDGDVISATLDMDIVRVVDALPSVGEANIIYLVPAEQPSESDLFEEWVWTDRWERIGSAKIDLSDYATKGYVDSKISSTEENLVHKNGYERITERKQFQKGIDIGLSNALVANQDRVQSGAWLDQNEDPAPFIVADPSADDHAATKYYVDEGLATKANLQHQHTVADITNFPELYYDATAFFTSGAYPSDKYEELLDAVKAKRTVYATVDEAGHISYVFFMSSANSDGSSSRVLLTTIFADGGYLYLNTFVLQQSGMTPLQESITGKANKATTLAGYGIGDAYTKSELDALLKGKQSILTDTDGGYGQRVANLEKEGIASQEKLTELNDTDDRMKLLLGYNAARSVVNLELGVSGKYVQCASRSAVANSAFAISKPFEVEACSELLIKTGFNPSDMSHSGLDLTVIAIYEEIERQRKVQKKDGSNNPLYYVVTIDENGNETVTSEETTEDTGYPVYVMETYTETRYLPNNEDRFVAIPDSGYYVANIPQSCKVVISYKPGATDTTVIVEKHGALANLISQVFGIYEHRTMVEAIVSLAARMDALESRQGLLGNAKAGNLDVSELTKCLYPTILRGHGVPAASTIPDNLPTGLPWDGVPVFIGQLYINLDATSSGLYYAKGHDSVSDWKQA